MSYIIYIHYIENKIIAFNHGSAIVWPDLDSWIKYWQAFQNYISNGIPVLSSVVNSNNSGCRQNSGEVSSTTGSSTSVSFTPENTHENSTTIRSHPPAKNSHKDVKKHKFHAKHNEHNKKWKHERHQDILS